MTRSGEPEYEDPTGLLSEVCPCYPPPPPSTSTTRPPLPLRGGGAFSVLLQRSGSNRLVKRNSHSIHVFAGSVDEHSKLSLARHVWGEGRGRGGGEVWGEKYGGWGVRVGWLWGRGRPSGATAEDRQLIPKVTSWLSKHPQS